MAVDIDYYDLLSIPRNATVDAINEAVKKAMRQWRKKTEAADLEIRQSAEQRIKQIEEARATLTDAGRRQAYSSKLEREGVKSAEAVPAAPAGGTWLSKAKEYVGRGAFHPAATPRGRRPRSHLTMRMHGQRAPWQTRASTGSRTHGMRRSRPLSSSPPTPTTTSTSDRWLRIWAATSRRLVSTAVLPRLTRHSQCTN